MDQTIIENFLQRTGLHLRTLSHEDVQKVWWHKGEVYRHALLKIREADLLAVTTTIVEETFPRAVLYFFEQVTDRFSLHGEETAEEKGEMEEKKQEIRKDFDLRPDLFAIDLAQKEIRLHEIEDAHPLEPRKLSKIINAYGWCDEEDVELRLFVYDRYGLSRREIDLPFLAFSKYYNGQTMFCCSLPGEKERVHSGLGVRTIPVVSAEENRTGGMDKPNNTINSSGVS